MKLQFKRITASGNFILKIDGLRFIAIISVLLYHISGFINVKYDYVNEFNLDYSFLYRILHHGNLGVPLFFVISGFILELSFAKFYIKKVKEVSLVKSTHYFRYKNRLLDK
jgi:peptidoglycan/LPS O-acetylase OafA/YrhL